MSIASVKSRLHCNGLQDSQSLSGVPKSGSTRTQLKPSVEIEEHAEVCSTSNNAVPDFCPHHLGFPESGFPESSSYDAVSELWHAQ